MQSHTHSRVVFRLNAPSDSRHRIGESRPKAYCLGGCSAGCTPVNSGRLPQVAGWRAAVSPSSIEPLQRQNLLHRRRSTGLLVVKTPPMRGWSSSCGLSPLCIEPWQPPRRCMAVVRALCLRRSQLSAGRRLELRLRVDLKRTFVSEQWYRRECNRCHAVAVSPFLPIVNSPHVTWCSRSIF